MLFEKLFLDRADLQKFQMFRVLKTLDTESFTINDISGELDFSYQQTYNIFQELLSDIESFDATASKTLSDKKILTQESFPITLDDYRLFLLKHSIIFNFVDYLVQYDAPNVDEFCRDNFISKSTLLRKSNNLKQLLQNYDLRFSYTNLNIIGDERNVRLFLYTFYWIGYHGVEWPFKNVSFNQCHETYQNLKTAKKDPISQLQEILLLGVCRVRMSKGNYIPDMERFKEVFPDYPPFALPVFAVADFPQVKREALQNETDFYYFSQTISISFVAKWKAESKQFYEYFKSTNSIPFQFTESFINYLTDFSNENEKNGLKDEMQLITNILHVSVAYYIMGKDYVKLLDFYYNTDEDHDQSTLHKIITNFFVQLKTKPTYRAFAASVGSMTTIFYYLLLPYLRHFQTNQIVRIKLMMETSDLLTRDMRIFLKDMNMVEILGDDQLVEDADVIITTIDNINPYFKDLKIPDGKVVVHWNLDAIDTDYYGLYLKIKNVFMQKLK